MIRLKDLLNEVNIPKELFHSVKDERTRDFIIQNGIKADENYMVYLSEKPIGAPYKYTFKVSIPNHTKLHDWREVWDDSIDKEYDTENPYYVYEGDIPKQYVKLI
jgi:hypothetical protein